MTKQKTTEMTPAADGIRAAQNDVNEARAADESTPEPWEVQDFGGRMLLRVSVDSGSTYGGDWYAVLERSSEGETVVQLDVGVIEVLIPEVHREHVRPRLSLVSLGEVSISDIRPSGFPLLIEEPESGRLRWRSVPAGAEVCLRGLDAEGQPFERTFVYPGGGPLVVEWP